MAVMRLGLLHATLAGMSLLAGVVSTLAAQNAEADAPGAHAMGLRTGVTTGGSGRDSSLVAVAGDSARVRPTHWVKGGVIGSVVVGGALGLLVNAMCESRCGSQTLSAAAVGGAAGFVIGALVGGAIPKTGTQ